MPGHCRLWEANIFAQPCPWWCKKSTETTSLSVQLASFVSGLLVSAGLQLPNPIKHGQASISGMETAVIITWTTMTINPRLSASFKPADIKMVSSAGRAADGKPAHETWKNRNNHLANPDPCKWNKRGVETWMHEITDFCNMELWQRYGNTSQILEPDIYKRQKRLCET